ncbi:MAG: Gfo/Idh/MocA family oxidoreductase [Clostridia bacterium]|nr:Gfo/Idh/MocA family oxidoreductase [Clostridia bacterium]
MDKLKVGIVGAAGRPSAFLAAFKESGKAALTAACDLNQEALDKALSDVEGVKRYTDYMEMLEKGDLDVVIIGTPMHLHVSQSIDALKKNINVFSEVTAAISIEECKMLLEACKLSRAQYMMGENCNYMKPYMIIQEMVRAGVFGDVFYAEGEYLHDIRELLYKTPWRRKYQFETRGITYGTHSLGPILSWMEGDRVESVCCVGTGRHNLDLKGAPIDGDDSAVMICKTAKGRLIKIRTDLSSPRPYSLNYVLQGTNAAYEGSFQGGGCSRDHVWINGKSAENQWDKLDNYEKKYLPRLWQDFGSKAEASGHGGSDVVIMTDFIDSIYEGRKVPIDIYDSLDMTLPGLVSQESILLEGRWLSVPDPRKW